MKRVTNISETVKREANNRNNESEQRNPSPSSSGSDSGRFTSSSRIKSHEEKNPPVNLEEGQ